MPDSGARMVMNYKGLVGYNSSSTNDATGITFSINAQSGSAYFNGEIVSSSGTIGGWSIGEDKLYSDTIELYATGGIGSLGGIKFTGATDYSIYNNFGLFTIKNSSDDQNILSTYSSEIRLGSSGTGGYSVQIKNDSLNISSVRNIYVSSSAGEPTPSSPQNGDIKLEW